MTTDTDDERPIGRPLANRRDGLSIDKAAEQAGVHPATIRNWIKAGSLPVTKFGPGKGVARIHPDDLEDVAGPH